MKRVALYVRVSTEEQKIHGLSVDNQIEALQEYAKQNNYAVVNVYNDAGISARKSYKKRPALLKLIKDCQSKKIDLILFTKLDRWFRSVGDYYEVQRLLDECAVPWRAIWEDYETETSSGVFKVNIMLSVAQSEADRTSERIKKVFDYKRSIGEVVSGAVAHGYIIQDKKWHFNPDQKEAIDIFYKHYLSTFKFTESYELACSHGLSCSYRTALAFLSNDSYYGNKPYIADAYITEEQFKFIRKNKRTYPKLNKFDYIYRGICRCGFCGAIMSGKCTTYVTKKGPVQTKMYICSRQAHGYDCIGATISEKNLDRYMLDYFEEELNKYNVILKATQSNIDKGRVTKLKAKLTRIKNLYELGDMEFDEYKQKRDSINDELKKIDAINMAEIKTAPTNWREIYDSLDTAHKNAFWMNAVDYVEVTGRKCKTPTIYF